MRLIDADTLINDIQTEWNGGEIQNAIWIWIRGVVRDQPTVPAAPRWVRCEDELPPKRTPVLVCSSQEVMGGIAVLKRVYIDEFEFVPSESIVAWMPLPEPPKDGV